MFLLLGLGATVPYNFSSPEAKFSFLLSSVYLMYLK